MKLVLCFVLVVLFWFGNGFQVDDAVSIKPAVNGNVVSGPKVQCNNNGNCIIAFFETFAQSVTEVRSATSNDFGVTWSASELVIQAQDLAGFVLSCTDSMSNCMILARRADTFALIVVARAGIQGSWVQKSPPTTVGTNFFFDISCFGTSTCIAMFTGSDGTRQYWTSYRTENMGTSWSAEFEIAGKSTTGHATIGCSMSCSNEGFCVGVGNTRSFDPRTGALLSDFQYSVTRSTDQGRTWSTPVEVPTFVDPNDTITSMKLERADIDCAFDGTTTPVCIATTRVFFGGSTFRSGASLIISRSTDGGQRWSVPQMLAEGSEELAMSHPKIKCTPQTAQCVLAYYPLAESTEFFVETTDKGATWSTQQTYLNLATDATFGPPFVTCNNQNGIFCISVYSVVDGSGASSIAFSRLGQANVEDLNDKEGDNNDDESFEWVFYAAGGVGAAIIGSAIIAVARRNKSSRGGAGKVGPDSTKLDSPKHVGPNLYPDDRSYASDSTGTNSYSDFQVYPGPNANSANPQYEYPEPNFRLHIPSV